MAEQAPVILASIPLTGHTRPMLSLARELVANGRSVTFLGGSRFAEAARSAGAGFVPLRGDADVDDRRMDLVRPRLASLPAGPEQLDEMFRWFADMAPGQHAALGDLLAGQPDAVLVQDMAFLGSWPALLGAPGPRPRTVTVGMLPFMFPGLELTLMGPPPPISGLDVRAAAAAMNAEIEAALAPSRDYQLDVLAGLGAVERFDSFSTAVYTLPDAFAQLTVEAFEYRRIDLPASVHLVGALAADSVPDREPLAWWSGLDDRPVVVVTQGTMANDDLNELVQPTLDALAGTDVTVVAAVGRETGPGELRVPGNAHIASSFLPFDRLFPLAEVVVTNGGYGGTQLALAHGVPVVVAGGSEDKPMTASRVATFGVGLDLGTRWPTPVQVAEAVSRVRRERSFRDRAASLAADYRAAEPVSYIIDLIEG